MVDDLRGNGMNHLKWLFSAACLAGGLYMLRSSYVAYGKWYHTLELGDPSGAELYEIEFWFLAPVSILLIVVGTFLAGRWSVRR